ncbi:hypothetical protein CXG81DRAFT_12362 [Caulochytrium protostelioides]|uniref:Nicotinate-nucleotide pyrophosphorylase [carboxylating] n=1 Tax=Caulochytrium protostelioides TaxID=1555241 RepID=A0A4P9X7W3_9FUNG|nr:hypothetical protein CXG81DRAFT_12362 [Caulochytrium protostelioides]|eukprot:RKP01150.1 hypothetical protein CXG81DRAFT_12362 [Caulochytrium protostelioides]
MSRQPLPCRAACLLSPVVLTRLVEGYLAEDAPHFDVGGYVVGDDAGTAHIYCKQRDAVLCGRPFVDEVFRQLGATVTWTETEGARVPPPDPGTHRVVVATVRGPMNRLLLGERVALNILARASGIASRAHALNGLKQQRGWPGLIVGTRKTTPGFRLVEKYAMVVGGADPHRYDLSGMVMLKDNHIAAVGSIPRAVASARAHAGFAVKIEVEVATAAGLREAVAAGADVVMLDNMSPADVAASIATLPDRPLVSDDGSNSRVLAKPRCLIEVSGGLTVANAGDYMLPGVDVLSFGSLSQGVPHVDFSMKLDIPKHA